MANKIKIKKLETQKFKSMKDCIEQYKLAGLSDADAKTSCYWNYQRKRQKK